MTENQLYKSLEKTAFWMRAVGLIMGLFNIFSWYIVFDHAFPSGFGNDTGRAIPGIICLAISSYATYIAFKAATSIKRYTQRKAPNDLQLAVEQETAFWTSLTTMVIGGLITIILIVTIRL